MEEEKPKKKRINSKSKGNGNELKLSKILAEHLAPLKFVRTQSSGAFTGGKNFAVRKHLFSEEVLKMFVGDIAPTNEADCEVNFRFVIEAKAYKAADSFDSLFTGKNKIYGWLDEVSVDCVKINKPGIVIFKFNNTPYYCAVRHDIVLPISYMTLPSGDKVCYLMELLKYKNFWFTSKEK